MKFLILYFLIIFLLNIHLAQAYDVVLYYDGNKYKGEINFEQDFIKFSIPLPNETIETLENIEQGVTESELTQTHMAKYFNGLEKLNKVQLSKNLPKTQEEPIDSNRTKEAIKKTTSITSTTLRRIKNQPKDSIKKEEERFSVPDFKINRTTDDLTNIKPSSSVPDLTLITEKNNIKVEKGSNTRRLMKRLTSSKNITTEIKRRTNEPKEDPKVAIEKIKSSQTKDNRRHGLMLYSNAFNGINDNVYTIIIPYDNMSISDVYQFGVGEYYFRLKKKYDNLSIEFNVAGLVDFDVSEFLKKHNFKVELGGYNSIRYFKTVHNGNPVLIGFDYLITPRSLALVLYLPDTMPSICNKLGGNENNSKCSTSAIFLNEQRYKRENFNTMNCIGKIYVLQVNRERWLSFYFKKDNKSGHSGIKIVGKEKKKKVPDLTFPIDDQTFSDYYAIMLTKIDKESYPWLKIKDFKMSFTGEKNLFII
jgi:hypothetical protein